MSKVYEDDIEDFLDDYDYDDEDDSYDDFWDDYDICYECQGNGDNYCFNELGEFEYACFDCPFFDLNQDDWDG